MGNLYSNLGQSYSNYKNAFLNLTNGRSVTGKAHINVDEELRSRQLMARYLYVLARLFITDEFLDSPNNKWFENDPFDPTINADQLAVRKKISSLGAAHRAVGSQCRRFHGCRFNLARRLNTICIPFRPIDLATLAQPKTQATADAPGASMELSPTGSGAAQLPAQTTKPLARAGLGLRTAGVVDHRNVRIS